MCPPASAKGSTCKLERDKLLCRRLQRYDPGENHQIQVTSHTIGQYTPEVRHSEPGYGIPLTDFSSVILRLLMAQNGITPTPIADFSAVPVLQFSRHALNESSNSNRDTRAV